MTVEMTGEMTGSYNTAPHKKRRLSLFIKTIIAVLIASTSHAATYAIDGDTIELDGTRIRINGIDAPEYGQKCGAWDCGKSAADKMSALLRAGTLRCVIHGQDGYGRSIATCEAGGKDIGEAMVLSGNAWAFEKYSEAYVEQQALARKAGLGIWGAPSVPAWEYRAAAWESAKQTAPKGCPIKGNITENGHIYHAPWSPWYARTRINEAKGERWFCSEDEAIKAGWRAPLWSK